MQTNKLVVRMMYIMSKRVTMKDIAENLKLSINAVSLVLNNKSGISEKTRLMVLKTANDMGYFDKKTKYLNTFASKNICLLLERRFFKDPYFYSKIIQGIEDEAKKNSITLIVNIIDSENYSIPICVQEKKASAVIALGNIPSKYILDLKSMKLPMILVDNTSFVENVDSIVSNNSFGTYRATKYLLDKGFKKIGFFGDLDYSISIKERYFGYNEALKNSIENVDISKYVSEFSITSGLEELVIKNDVKSIIEKLSCIEEMPEAFICSNDSAAIQLSNALSTLNYKIPEDISIIGFDDTVLCNMVMPKLTTVRVNKELMGRKAVQRLLWRINHINEPIESIVMEVELIERDSVK